MSCEAFTNEENPSNETVVLHNYFGVKNNTNFKPDVLKNAYYKKHLETNMPTSEI